MNLPFGRELRKEFSFDETAVLLNNGSYGSVPKLVQEKQRQLKAEMDFQPDSWFRRRIPQLWRQTVKQMSSFLGANPENLVLIENVTYGINSIMRSLLNAGKIGSGDAILITSLQYNQVRVFCEEVIQEPSGLDLRKLELSFPLESKEQIVQKYADFLDQHPEVKLTFLDHITSPTSVLMPLEDIAKVCKQRNVIVAVDGAHAPGQIPLNLENLGVDFYSGNIHKWVFTARGSGFLWVAPQWHSITKPAVASHFHGFGMQANFCIRGTGDVTAFHTLPVALEFISQLGGLESISNYITGLIEKGVRHLVETWNTEELPISRDLQAPFMRVVRLPEGEAYPLTLAGCNDLETHLYEKFNIQTALFLIGERIYVRLSGAVYTEMEDFVKLGAAVLELTPLPSPPVKQDKGYRMPLMHWDMSPLFNNSPDL